MSTPNAFGDDNFLQSLDPEALLGERDLSKLRWRCRRGLLENDLKIDAYFKRHPSGLRVKQAQALYDLMMLSDNDLMDLLLQRTQLSVELDNQAHQEVLAQLRMNATMPSPHTH